MEYINEINKALRIKKKNKIKLIDLFAGCGGLSLGFEANGFNTIGYELNEDACNTYNTNLNGNCNHVKLDLEISYPTADILIAGPPCQPYSKAGLKKGQTDNRNGFPIFIDALDKINPEIAIFENVKGLLNEKSNYFEVLIKQLNIRGYNLNYDVLNSKDYLVPQSRERLFLIACKGKSKFMFPNKSERIIPIKAAIGKVRSKIPKDTIILNSYMDDYIKKYEIASKCKNPRDLNLETPSRTLTCRNLSGMTGDMIRLKLSNGKRRTLSISEAALLQSFPSSFKFIGNKNSVMNQIGNAVPPMMSYSIAKSILNQYYN